MSSTADAPIPQTPGVDDHQSLQAWLSRVERLHPVGIDMTLERTRAVAGRLGLRFEAGLYFDVALLIALFGFVGSSALAKFLLRGEVIEP